MSEQATESSSRSRPPESRVKLKRKRRRKQKRAGRPSHKPTEEQRKHVQGMVAIGVTLRQIAPILGIDRNTLSKYYRYEIDTAAVTANTTVAQNLFNLTKTQWSACKFWLINRDADNWKDMRHNENMNHVVPERPDLSQCTAEEVAALREAAGIIRRIQERQAAPMLEGTATTHTDEGDDEDDDGTEDDAEA